jgi:endonuclease YncB( thermonuclease family)
MMYLLSHILIISMDIFHAFENGGMPMRRFACALLVLVLGCGGAEARRDIVGVVSHMRDGDTLVIAGIALRLLGLHAPELREPGGVAARAWMVERTAGQVVVCRLTGARSHGRRIAVYRNRDGDLAAQLIAAGLGRDCPRYSAARYAGLETDTARRLALPAYCRPR